jgi:glycosyltransferase involved in cell wall biosynthesis
MLTGRPPPIPVLPLVHVGPLAECSGRVGGVGFYLAELVNALPTPRRAVVLAQRSETIPVPDADVRNIWKPGRGALLGIDRALPRTPSIVHVQYETSLYGSPLVSFQLPYFIRRWRRLGHRVVVTMHHVVGRDFDVEQLRLWKPSSPYDSVLPMLLRRLQRAIVSAADVAIVHETSQRIVFEDLDVRVVPLFIPARPKLPLGDPGPVLRLVFFGFLAPYKGVLELARAVAALAVDGRPVALDVIGGAHPRLRDEPGHRRFLAELEAVAARSPAVSLHGYLSDAEVDAKLAAADLTMLPYRAVISASAALARAASLGVGFAVSRPLAETLHLPEGTLSFEADEAGIMEFLRQLTRDDIEAARERSRTYARERSIAAVAAAMGRLYGELSG